MLMMNDLQGSIAAGMLSFESMCGGGGVYEQQPPKPRLVFKMPRVVPDQKNKFDTDELFRRLSRESDVNTIHGLQRSAARRTPKSIPNRMPRRSRRHRVHRDRNQFATDVHAEHADRVVPPSAGQRQLRFRKRTRNGTHTVAFHHERGVRAVERTYRSGQIGRYRLSGVRRGTSNDGEPDVTRANREIQRPYQRVPGQAPCLPEPGARRRRFGNGRQTDTELLTRFSRVFSRRASYAHVIRARPGDKTRADGFRFHYCCYYFICISPLVAKCN